MEQNRITDTYRRIVFFIIVFCLAFACKNISDADEKETDSDSLKVTPVECENEVSYGKINYCLPEIEGYKECYNHPEVRSRADEIEDPDNITLGYYINDSIYSRVNEIEDLNYDNYYKIYVPNAGMDYNMTASEMKQIMSMMSTGFLDKSMEDTNEEIKRAGKEVELSQPILLEKFELNDRSSTILVLMRVRGENIDKVMAISMSSVLSKKRLLFIAHYLDYQDETTLVRLRENTTLYIEAFLKVNS